MNYYFLVDEIKIQQEYMNVLKQSVVDQRPVVERINKTGDSLKALLTDPEADELQEILDVNNKRFDDVKEAVRERADSLVVALDETSQVLVDLCELY